MILGFTSDTSFKQSQSSSSSQYSQVKLSHSIQVDFKQKSTIKFIANGQVKQSSLRAEYLLWICFQHMCVWSQSLIQTVYGSMASESVAHGR